MDRFVMDTKVVRQPGEALDPVVTADLLAILGVTEASSDAQEQAVAQWLSTNPVPRFLAVALRAGRQSACVLRTTNGGVATVTSSQACQA